MMKDIRAHWIQLKAEYENRYKESFLEDFERSKDYLKQMKEYLLSKLKERPSDVDVICTLASVKLELGEGDTEYIKLLEDFLDRFSNEVDDKQVARIYTNIAFIEDYSRRALDYLTKAKDLKSPYVETYKALGLYYFPDYDFSKEKKNIERSNEFFKHARELEDSYESNINYGASLYALGEYQEAKKIFEKLITVYPDRMWLKLCIAYCDVALGNKATAISYLENIKIGSDDNYDLNTDDIMEYQVFDAYYALEEYDRFLSYCTEEVDKEYYTVDWEHLYYVLWISGKRDRFTRLEEKNRKYLEGAIADAIVDTEYDSEKEKQETIESWEEDKRDFEEMISRIKNKQLRPEMELKLYPEYSCYMVDCVRHKF